MTSPNKILENVGHRGAETLAGVEAAEAAALIKGGVAETVIGRALLRIAEALIGFVQLLETRFRLLVSRVPIGMTLHRRLAEGDLQFDFRHGAADAQNFVIVAFGHALFCWVRHSVGCGGGLDRDRMNAMKPGVIRAGFPFRYRIGAAKASPGLLLIVADVLELRVDHVVLGRFRGAGARGLGLLRLVHRLAELH